ncbi:non-functional NADPH-dependent codeinone reductase 2-like [Selaginella moellendorffii]|uniref:non-functional NADPH-dependent codeinone reductase 2-like n=1 Tax=Selaginella moellendorffii TaxID=88036 RepID=UPI000D1CD555|nr:non-functional NADPH-dependent codeinone reductase 2-like [Selaginella moellendorffii]|eukprot:XP_024523881.1 non-functional NADPH-dependent codeinone reductase 2-like [Selaginella moellendorffii]
MEECFRKGLAKAIGVSNFSTKKLHDLLQHAKITPAVDQVIIRWLTEIHVAPVVKSYNSQRLLENINSFDFSLAGGDHKRFESIAQERIFTTSPYKSPFELWDGEI